MLTEYDADDDTTTKTSPRRTSNKLTSSKTSKAGSIDNSEKDTHFRSSLPRQPTSAFNSITFHRKSEIDYSSSDADDSSHNNHDDGSIMDLREHSHLHDIDASLISLGDSNMPRHWKAASSSGINYNPKRNNKKQQQERSDVGGRRNRTGRRRGNR